MGYYGLGDGWIFDVQPKGDDETTAAVAELYRCDFDAYSYSRLPPGADDKDAHGGGGGHFRDGTGRRDG